MPLLSHFRRVSGQHFSITCGMAQARKPVRVSVFGSTEHCVAAKDHSFRLSGDAGQSSNYLVCLGMAPDSAAQFLHRPINKQYTQHADSYG